MPTTALEFDATIFDRLVVPPEQAQAMLAIDFAPDDHRRMEQLVDKNNKGAITDEERLELESYRRAGTLLSILQAKARAHLRDAGS